MKLVLIEIIFFMNVHFLISYFAFACGLVVVALLLRVIDTKQKS